jgi:hypothetical protein
VHRRRFIEEPPVGVIGRGARAGVGADTNAQRDRYADAHSDRRDPYADAYPRRSALCSRPIMLRRKT